MYLDIVSTHRAGKCGRLVEEMRAFKGTVIKIWEENGCCLDVGTDPKHLTTVGLTLLDLGITVCRLLDILLDSTAASPEENA